MATQGAQCTLGFMALQVLTWNLFHGRSVPGAGGELPVDFAAALAGWEWDVALLQEVPPWWPRLLGSQLGASARVVLTSRNELLAARRAVAVRWPDLIKSNGGGCNAILVRREAVVEHRRRWLCRVPERRWLHGVRLPCGLWVGNLHATAHHDRWAWRDGRLAAATALGWAGGGPVVLGGDFNLRSPSFPGFAWAGGHDVDHVFVAPFSAFSLHASRFSVLDRGRLSDHAPVLVTVEPSSQG
jgi:endonuclease/exonuclease/phosphatase family metal-dependent hydrolase